MAAHCSMLHIPPTNCPFLPAQQVPYKKRKEKKRRKVKKKEKKKAQLSKKMFESGEWSGPLAEKRQDRKSERTRQKSKRGERKEESNDSPEIADRGLRHPGLPTGWGLLRQR